VNVLLKFLIPAWFACAPWLVAEPQPDWRRFTEVAQRHGLPLPAAGARLALIHSGSWRPVGNSSHPHDPANYEPGWVIKENADGSVDALRGTQIVHLDLREAREPMWREFVAKRTAPELGGYVAEFDRGDCLIAAVQCAATGDPNHAGMLWQLYESAKPIRSSGLTKEERQMLASPEGLLAAMLLEMWTSRLTNPAEPRPAIEVAMSGLLAAFPALAGRGQDTLLADLRLTNRAPAPEMGSVAALLIELGRREPCPVISVLDEDWDGPAGRIVRQGFASIPELLRLRQDRRVTCWRDFQMSGLNAGPRRLGFLADILLGELLPEAAASLRENRFEETWANIRLRNEADYFAEAAFTRKGRVISRVEPGPLAVLAEKFSDRLPPLIGEFLIGADAAAQSCDLARAVVRSKLPDRSGLLAKRAGQGSLEHRTCFTQVLARFEPAAAKAPALALIRHLPPDAKGAYWTSPVSWVAQIVVMLDDEEVWQALLGVARRAPVGLRLECLNPLANGHAEGPARSRRLAFLAAFWDDRSQRVEASAPVKYSGPNAAFRFPVITVRDFALMQIATILQLDPLDSPDSTWTAARWETLHAKVRERLKAEGIAPMEER
jgi:hypothetical protein